MDKIVKQWTSGITELQWKDELEKSSERYHVLVCWLAIIFDPIFGITDYLNIPNHWQHILMIRCTVSLLSLIPLLLRKKYRIPTYIIVFVPFLLISLQNAYTYSLIGLKDFTGHTLNYLALFIGAGMFILWKWQYSATVVLISAIACIFFFEQNHAIGLQEILINGGFLLIVVAFFMILLIQTRYSLTVKEIKSRLALVAANQELLEQKQIIEWKNKDITDSIRYARRIQESILPAQIIIKKELNCFILYKPKDIVSGDFYWFSVKEDLVIIAAVDCTGHGVPGAFMSVLGNSILNQIVNENDVVNPSEILSQLDRKVRSALDQGDGSSQDGMDIALCVIDKVNQKMGYAGAKRPLYMIRNKEINEIKVNKIAIGGHGDEHPRFESVVLQMQPNDLIYLTSDGYADQFGGKDKTKYMTKNFKKFLLTIHHLDLSEQAKSLDTEIEFWKGEEKQTDDILVIGVKF
jgi:serine phosphatase RsbU (regulator of sigma subunit)